MNITSLEGLITNITDNYKADKNLLSIAKYLEVYQGQDWKNYVVQNYNYYKNLVFRNDDLEIYIITWISGASSRIHDHPEKGCLLKVLQGELTETEYTKDDLDINYKNTKTLKKDDIGFQISNTILHKINNNMKDIAVSLHIYSKPNFMITYY